MGALHYCIPPITQHLPPLPHASVCLPTSHTPVPLCSARSRYLISQHLAGLVLSPTPQSWPFTAYSCANSPISPLQRGSPSHPLLHSLVFRLSSLLLIPISTKFPDFSTRTAPVPAHASFSSLPRLNQAVSSHALPLCPSEGEVTVYTEAEGVAVPEGKACLALQCNTRRCLELQPHTENERS